MPLNKTMTDSLPVTEIGYMSAFSIVQVRQQRLALVSLKWRWLIRPSRGNNKPSAETVDGIFRLCHNGWFYLHSLVKSWKGSFFLSEKRTFEDGMCFRYNMTLWNKSVERNNNSLWTWIITEAVVPKLLLLLLLLSTRDCYVSKDSNSLQPGQKSFGKHDEPRSSSSRPARWNDG